MAVPTNVQVTPIVGTREDLSDNIFRVDIEERPFMEMAGTKTAKNTLHEWQTRALGSVNTDNAVPEGDDIDAQAATPTVRLGNVCQISRKALGISGTAEAVDKAGRKSELAMQKADRAIELLKDIEAISLSNQGYSNASVRRVRGFEAWIRTNVSRGAGGANPADPSTTPATTATDGTQRAFTEALLLDNLQAIFVNGGKTQISLMGPTCKRAASTFVGRVNSHTEIDAKKITQATTLYASDFGNIKFVTHRYLRGATAGTFGGRTVYNIDPSMVNLAYLKGRKFVDGTLAKSGDSDKRFMLSEWSLEMCNEKAHGVIADLICS